MNRMNARNAWIPLLLLLSVVSPALAFAANVAGGASGDRHGAGLRVGRWDVQDLDLATGETANESVLIEGFFQKPLDRNLVVENTLGFWQRTRDYTSTGVGGTTTFENTSYLVPMLTALKLYPMGHAANVVEPYLLGGVGFVLGIDRGQVSGNDPVYPAGESTALQSGLGIQTGAGLEFNGNGQFGLTVGGRYQWASFSDDVGGKGLYRGPAFTAGLTYRFRN
jgi:hypothetical protein